MLDSLRTQAAAQHSNRREVESLQTQVNTLQTTCTHLATQNNLLMVRMNEILNALGRSVGPTAHGPTNHQRDQATVETLTATNEQSQSVEGDANSLLETPVANNATGQVSTNANDENVEAGILHQVTPIPIAMALQRPRATVTGRRGSANKSESVEACLQTLYEARNNRELSNCKRTLGGNLECCKAFILNRVFRGKRRTDYKVEKILRLIDALWTKEEREKTINHEFQDDQEVLLFKDLARRCANAAHVILHMNNYNQHDILPNRHKPTNRCGTQVSGLSNNLGDFNISSFVPNWNQEGYPVQAEERLSVYVQEQQELLKTLMGEHPEKVEKRKPRTNK